MLPVPEKRPFFFVVSRHSLSDSLQRRGSVQHDITYVQTLVQSKVVAILSKVGVKQLPSINRISCCYYRRCSCRCQLGVFYQLMKELQPLSAQASGHSDGFRRGHHRRPASLRQRQLAGLLSCPVFVHVYTCLIAQLLAVAAFISTCGERTRGGGSIAIFFKTKSTSSCASAVPSTVAGGLPVRSG